MSTQLRVCGIYAVDLPDESQSTTISAAAIENVKFDYQPGDAPRATAKRAANQYNYDILYECWQQFETTNPLPPGTPTTTPTALCPPSPHLKTARPMCIPSC